ncbi:HAD-superfamily hydrolase, subfamily IIB [Clostridium aceticum]|uniref:HAD-superfamily hydrolase, subfamily IIB n=1 Tax=Clostridium aceticum TaxID=84022 RepID=A0A0D8IDY7_9CLOT|nr:Cof-type HAD-IIB family hydrolase [Clostridium aceticum]AKL94473.1 HAD-superfamily hydrolase, subfamily IIB [Clostridium aceticum]KJF28309.1 haloacid dehalogenase [Clostridium aceticum]
MKYKLAVLDMDGTLLNSKHEISEENKRALREAMKCGVKIAIATGRIYTSAGFYAKLLGLATPIIACNGAFIKEPLGEEGIYSNPIKTEDVLKVIELCKEHNLYFQFYDEENFYVETLSHSALKYHNWNKKQKEEDQIKILQLEDAASYLKVKDIKVLKISIMDDDPKNLENIKNIISKIDSVEVNKSWYDNIEVMNRGVSKGKAIEALGKILDIHGDEIIAFGDNYNDLSMKDYVKTFVAMGNGEVYVKQQADYITDSNDDSGVARGIYKLVLGEKDH